MKKFSCVHIDGSLELQECMRIAGEQIHYCPCCGGYLYDGSKEKRIKQLEATISKQQETIKKMRDTKNHCILFLDVVSSFLEEIEPCLRHLRNEKNSSDLQVEDIEKKILRGVENVRDFLQEEDTAKLNSNGDLILQRQELERHLDKLFSMAKSLSQTLANDARSNLESSLFMGITLITQNLMTYYGCVLLATGSSIENSSKEALSNEKEEV